MKYIYFLSILFFISCWSKPEEIIIEDPKVVLERAYDTLFVGKERYISDGFDFPVGKPNAKGYYNAQGFLTNHHLGDDWNGLGGGDTDIGLPIYSVSHGLVTYAGDAGEGWGNVIRVVHKLEGQGFFNYVESLYAHCDEITIEEGKFIRKGTKIGTIGNADGYYKAHLHFEMRHNVALPLGGGYAYDYEGYLNPTLFIEANRKIPMFN